MKCRSTCILFLMLLFAAPAVAQDDATPPPPCSSPEHRQFDFWIGNWDVHTADGTFAGTNNVTRILGSCVIQEHWEGSAGLKGESYNIYAAADKKWFQTWVDAAGRRLDLSGGFADGKMVMSGKTTTPNGVVVDKISWELLEDGRVRQHWERSNDDGDTWNDLFVGFYSKKKEE